MAPSRPPLVLRQLIGVRGAKVKLRCEACRWSRTYDPVRLAERLEAKGVGGTGTAIMLVAGQVTRACPGCGRRRWATAPWPDHWSASARG
jgi:hypothetical protein